MTVLNPVQAAYGDLAEVAAGSWQGRRLLVTLSRFGDLAWRLADWPPWEFRPFVGVPKEAAERICVLVVGRLFLVAWANPVTGMLRFLRYDPVLRAPEFGPVTLVPGTSPTLALYWNTRLMLGYAQGGEHVRIQSQNLGASWVPGPPVEEAVDAGSGNIGEVDASTAAVSSQEVQWIETDLPLPSE